MFVPTFSWHRCFKEQRYKINASNSQLFVCPPLMWLSCFKEQRYKINASNSQLAPMPALLLLRCFKEQRYKINASNSQLSVVFPFLDIGCFKEQRYKINASNSQLAVCVRYRLTCCFKEQRYKINASNSQLFLFHDIFDLPLTWLSLGLVLAYPRVRLGFHYSMMGITIHSRQIVGRLIGQSFWLWFMVFLWFQIQFIFTFVSEKHHSL